MGTGGGCRVVVAAGFILRSAVSGISCFRFWPRAGCPESPACRLEGIPAAAVGENPEVADAVQLVRQDVDEETRDERVHGNGLGAVAQLRLPGRLRPAAPEGDALPVEGDDAAIADGDPVGVARQVGEDLTGLW